MSCTYHNNPSSVFDIHRLLPDLYILFGARELNHARMELLKNTKNRFNPLYGNDRTTTVVRMVMPRLSVIIKQHCREDRFRNERCNLLFLNEIFPDVVPRVIAVFEAHRTLVLEDLGDKVPEDPREDIHCCFWERAVKIIAEIHSVAFSRIQRLRELYGGALPKHEPQSIHYLSEAISIAMFKCGLLNNGSARSYLRRLLSMLTKDLCYYRDKISGFALSERSITNIRVLGTRIAFIDLVQPPVALPHLDLIPIWHSPYRDRLVQCYLNERKRFSSTFDDTLFHRADLEFIILESLRWIAIRLGTLPVPCGFVTPVKDKRYLTDKVHSHYRRIREATRKLESFAPGVTVLAKRALPVDTPVRIQIL